MTMTKPIVTVGLLAAGLALAVACMGDSEADLEVRTFELQHIDPNQAINIIDPYVFDERAHVSAQQELGLLTVREVPEMLDRIEQVLAEYDRPEPGVRLHFRIIEANGGGGGSDPALEEIEAALPRDIFRFQNYRQVAEAVLVGLEWSDFEQRLFGDGDGYRIEGRLGEVRAAEDSGTVLMEVALLADEFGSVFHTAVNVRLGQLLVLGGGQHRPGGGALMLAVQAEVEGR